MVTRLHPPAAVADTHRGAGAASTESATEQAYQRLHREILTGLRAPGDPLRFDALRNETGFGVSALREALIRLGSEHFVEAFHNRGFRVAPLTLKELTDINRARVLVESEGLALAIDKGDVAWEGAIVSALYQLKRQPEHGSKSPGSAYADEWEHHHYAFHRCLISACGSEWLLRIFDTLYPQYQRYRRFIWLHVGLAISTRSLENVAEEHEALAQATLRRDKKSAVELLQRHYNNNVQVLLSICESQPGLMQR